MGKFYFFVIVMLLSCAILAQSKRPDGVSQNVSVKTEMTVRQSDSLSAINGDSLSLSDGDTLLVDSLTAMDSLWMMTDKAAFDTVTFYDIKDSINFGFQKERTIDVIVIHSNYYVGDDGANPFSTEGCIRQFRTHDVAPHYMIERNGNILQMVDERYIAWHAGPSLIPGTDRTRVNQNSIGIEVINTRTDPPTPEQYKSLLSLVVDIRHRYNIKYLMRHSDIAPGRKTDPWCFDWKNFCRKVRELTGDIVTAEETSEMDNKESNQ